MKISELPKDLLEEILCRVPATSLKRLRTTCKRWNSLFKDDRSFASKHYDTAAKQFSVVMLKELGFSPMSFNLNGTVPSVEVKSELNLVNPETDNPAFQFDLLNVCHCDDLLLYNLYVFRDETRIVVWNPLTGGCRWLRARKRGQFRSVALGYDKKSCIKSYKILSFRSRNGINESEIYEFDSDSWRILDYDIAPGWEIEGTYQIVSLKGKAYFFALDRAKTYLGIYSLLCFDFKTEESSGALPLPYPCHRNRIATLSVVRQEKLALLFERDDNTSKTEIWVTNKIDDETNSVVSWSKVLTLDLSIEDLHISEDVSFLLDEEKKVFVWCDRWIDEEDEDSCKEMVYIVGEDGKITQVHVGEDIYSSCCQVERKKVD